MPDGSGKSGSLPNLDEAEFRPIDREALFDVPRALHKPRVLMLYGSLRERSYSRFATEEAARILEKLGAEVRIFNPSGLPQVGFGSAGPSEGQGTARSFGLVGGPCLVLA